jgi:hypothetical protein
MVKRVATLIMLLTTVMSVPASALTEPGRDVFLEAQTEPAQVYVQSQAVYRLRFYQAIDMRDLNITGPSARLADLRQIGAGRIYETQRDGRRYRVHERSYAVFPFASGTLEMGGASASGRVAAPSPASGDGRHALRLEAPQQILTVLPVPANAGAAPWLPARSLTLSETWSPASGEAQLGEAQRRSVRIEAAGVDAAQLPELHIAAGGMTVHAEPEHTGNRFDGELNIASREQTFLMIPQRAGDIVVPELQLRWWNAASDTPASAALPARTVHVNAGNAAMAAAKPPMPTATAHAPTIIPTAEATTTALRHYTLSFIVMGVFGVVAALIYFRRTEVLVAWELYRACRSGRAEAVRDGLLAWVGVVWIDSHPLTLAALAESLKDPETRSALNELERSLYGPERGKNDAKSLAATVRRVKREVRQCACRLYSQIIH